MCRPCSEIETIKEMWVRMNKSDQRIEKLEQDVKGLKQENEKLIKHLWALPFEPKADPLKNITTEARKALDELLKPKPQYTRGQEVEVNISGDWKPAIYLEEMEDVYTFKHKVVYKTSYDHKIEPFSDSHIRPATQTTEG